MLPDSSNVTTFDLVRHGAVDGPAALYGLTDIELSEAGDSAVSNVLTWLPAITHVVTSPLKRCSNSALELAKQRGVAVDQLEEIKECHFGEWDGVPFESMGAEWKAVEQFFYSPFENPPPQGETVDALYDRVTRGWDYITATHTSGHIAVICHGGVIRQILAFILGLDWRSQKLYRQLDIRYASVTRIQIARFAGAVPQIKFIGLTASELQHQSMGN
ncbi:histidine phosphatase family protein [Alteromonas sp. KUL49]|uniref:histidine phosphatase family protein n=1 Tax=Alteromonas sp. KUL49 TaxID=2480798 RepID=UPI00102EE57F|nr:histidine phosphatase family protein [Alteromonas sp. KUL49]TAP39253.1 histidine phosphatase family protein [Alteromonas sp. KUL49]GEA12034.1 alpha-ribazole phosphatase [Alteromonas sp. KUL49]